MESFIKGPRASRSVIRALYDPSGYSNRRCRHPEGICPEPTRLLHVKLLSHGLQKAARPCASIKPWHSALSRGDVPMGGTTRAGGPELSGRRDRKRSRPAADRRLGRRERGTCRGTAGRLRGLGDADAGQHGRAEGRWGRGGADRHGHRAEPRPAGRDGVRRAAAGGPERPAHRRPRPGRSRWPGRWAPSTPPWLRAGPRTTAPPRSSPRARPRRRPGGAGPGWCWSRCRDGSRSPRRWTRSTPAAT